jgi:hypothetical protein
MKGRDSAASERCEDVIAFEYTRAIAIYLPIVSLVPNLRLNQNPVQELLILSMNHTWHSRSLRGLSPYNLQPNWPLAPRSTKELVRHVPDLARVSPEKVHFLAGSQAQRALLSEILQT